MNVEAPRLLTAGQSSFLVETGDTAHTLGLVEQLRRDPPSGMLDFLPAESTVMVFAAPGADMAALRTAVARLARVMAPTDDAAVNQEAVTVPVHYDGEDLPDVAESTGLTIRDIVTRHSSQLWRCSFIGFAPGFSYLIPTSGCALNIPRRRQSRPAVPPGAVALAGHYTAVYPRSSPGGWQIIGRTNVQMWNVDNDPPALIRPGAHVRFVDAGSSPGAWCTTSSCDSSR